MFHLFLYFLLSLGFMFTNSFYTITLMPLYLFFHMEDRESTQNLDQMAAHIPCPDLPHACLHALPRFHAYDLNIPQGGEQKILLVQVKTYSRRTNASSTVCTGMLPSTLITNHPRKPGPRPFWPDPSFASTVICPWRSELERVHWLSELLLQSFPENEYMNRPRRISRTCKAPFRLS